MGKIDVINDKGDGASRDAENLKPPLRSGTLKRIPDFHEGVNKLDD
jgi:hypothetical protein